MLPSAIVTRPALPSGGHLPVALILPRRGSAGSGKLLEYQSIASRLPAFWQRRGPAMPVTQEQIHSALKEVLDPNTGKDFHATKSAKNIRVEGANVSLDIELGYPGKTQFDSIRKLITGKLRAIPGVSGVTVGVTSKIVSHSVQRGVKLVPSVKNIVAVASGKGGVGKSTTAVNLALALAAEGASVGVLDADIYGPSQPTMLGITGRPESKDGKTLEPMTGHGIQAISIGFLIDIDTPMVWRGPMVTQALEQLLKDTRWRDVDYLIVDMLLGSLPLDIAIREQADSGKPTVVADPDGRAAEIYRAIGRRLAVKIAESARDMTSKFPNIVVSKNT